MAWIDTIIPEYGIQNFNTDWNDGRPVCGMVDHIRPGTCPNHLALDRRRGLENCQLGMDLAEEHLNIPKVLSPEDLHNPDVDDLSVMTYLSYFCDPANQQLLQWIRKKVPHRNIRNLSTDWNDGINLGALAEACFSGLCPDWQKMEPTNAIQNNERMIKLIKDRLGIDCHVSASELANPKVDEIVVATYLSKFRNAKLRASPEEFALRVPTLPYGSTIVREPVSFEIEATKEAANLADEIRVSAHGPSSDINVTLTPKDNGNLDASFVPTEAGSYEIFAVYSGEHIQGSPFSLKVADPSKCQVLGDLPTTLQVGQSETIVVKTRGAGIGKLTCTFDDTEKSTTPIIASDIEEQNTETFEVKLLPNEIGEALVELKWAGNFIPQSPFRVSICDASKCSVTGEGLTSGEGKVGEPVEFTISTKGAGNSKPVVKPRGPSAQYSPEIKDNDDDTYNASFTPWEVGPHKVDVLWGGEHVPGSPFSMNITPAPDANTCSATGKGLKRAIAGQPTKFTILSPEKGLLEKKDGLLVTVSSLQADAPVEMVEKDDGSYTVTYTAPDPGAYMITVKFYEKNIPGSPFKLEVVPAPNASKCRAYGPALHPNSLHIAGTPLDLYVDTTKAGTGELQVVVKGPNNTKPKVYMADDKGIYSLKFDVPEPGRYHVHIWWSQVYIPNSPFKIRVHPGPNAAMVKAYGPGLKPDFEVGAPADFTIETKNAGIGTLTIRVHGVKGAFKIECNPLSESDPRTLKALYDPKEPGDYIVTIRWSGMHVPGSPFKVHILSPEKEEKEKKDKKKEKKEKSSKVSLVVPDDVDVPGVAIVDGVPVMTKEQARVYQHQLLQRQRLAQAGYPHMNPAFAASGGARGMQRKLKVNPSMTNQAFQPEDAQAVVTSTVTSSKFKSQQRSIEKTTEVHGKEKPESTPHIDDSPQKGKKKRKHKF